MERKINVIFEKGCYSESERKDIVSILNSLYKVDVRACERRVGRFLPGPPITIPVLVTIVLVYISIEAFLRGFWEEKGKILARKTLARKLFPSLKERRKGERFPRVQFTLIIKEKPGPKKRGPRKPRPREIRITADNWEDLYRNLRKFI